MSFNREALSQSWHYILAADGLRANPAACAFLIFTGILIVRWFFLKSIYRMMRAHSKKAYKEMLGYYQNPGLLGWFFLLLAVALFTVALSFPNQIERVYRKDWISLGVVVFLIGIVCQAKALARAAILTLSEKEGLE